VDKHIDIFINQKKPTRITGWRFLHRSEGSPRWNPDNMPEIRNAVNGDYTTTMEKNIQLLAWHGVMQKLNPILLDKKYPQIHSGDTAVNNGDNNGYNDRVPHSDWVNMENLTADPPRYSKMYGFGGQMTQGDEEYSVMQTLRDAVGLMGKIVTRSLLMQDFRKDVKALVATNTIRIVPGKHCIDPKNLPTAQEVLDKHWYSNAISVYANGTVGDFENGRGGVISYLWIASRDALFPKSYFQWWDDTFYPDHLTMYVTS